MGEDISFEAWILLLLLVVVFIIMILTSEMKKEINTTRISLRIVIIVLVWLMRGTMGGWICWKGALGKFVNFWTNPAARRKRSYLLAIHVIFGRHRRCNARCWTHFHTY